jgi:hypothetical protein
MGRIIARPYKLNVGRFARMHKKIMDHQKGYGPAPVHTPVKTLFKLVGHLRGQGVGERVLPEKWTRNHWLPNSYITLTKVNLKGVSFFALAVVLRPADGLAKV